jgi:hypothetical protein
VQQLQSQGMSKEEIKQRVSIMQPPNKKDDFDPEQGLREIEQCETDVLMITAKVKNQEKIVSKLEAELAFV